MDEQESVGPREANPPRNMDAARPRAVGSPLPKGDPGKGSGPLLQGEPTRLTPFTVQAADQDELPEELDDDPSAQSSSLQKAVKGVRMALPFVQKVLPLLDGQVIATLANLLAPRHAQAPPVNLTPIEGGIAELQTQQRKLREQVVEQNVSLKKVEDRLEMVREATDRNTLEQQELLDDLKSVRRKLTVFAVIALLLLAASVGLNTVLFLYMRGFLK